MTTAKSLTWERVGEFRRFFPAWHSQTPAPSIAILGRKRIPPTPFPGMGTWRVSETAQGTQPHRYATPGFTHLSARPHGIVQEVLEEKAQGPGAQEDECLNWSAPGWYLLDIGLSQ